MKKILLQLGADIILTILFAIALIGAPIFMLSLRFKLYERQIDRATIIGLIVVLMIFAVVKFLLKAWIYTWPLKWYKKLAWGIEQSIPLIFLSLFSYWITNNVEFVKEILLYTILSHSVSYLVAPSYVLKYKEGSND